MLPAILVGAVVVWVVRTVKKKRKQEKANQAWRNANLPKAAISPRAELMQQLSHSDKEHLLDPKTRWDLYRRPGE